MGYYKMKHNELHGQESKEKQEEHCKTYYETHTEQIISRQSETHTL